MKKIITFIIISILSIAGIAAQETEKITVSALRAERSGDNVIVTFTAAMDKKAAPASHVFVYAPVITSGDHKVSLPAIVVRGRQSRKALGRAAWAAGESAEHPDAIYTKPGRTIEYSATVPFQYWMHDSVIEAETVSAGCCNAVLGSEQIAANILPAPLPEPEPEIMEPEKTVSEILTETFSFVLHASDFDPDEPIKFYDDERDNSLTIFFKINEYGIEEDYVDNRQTLINLIASIKIIHDSPEAYVDRIVVAGFASPEGPFEINDRLAWERAVSVKEYIIRNTDMSDESIMLFNGSADWRGLRLLVEANKEMPDREKVLDIINNHPVWDPARQTGRISMIRGLSNGETYRYMAANIFPKLRNGTFIRVYFDSK